MGEPIRTSFNFPKIPEGLSSEERIFFEKLLDLFQHLFYDTFRVTGDLEIGGDFYMLDQTTDAYRKVQIVNGSFVIT